MQAQAPVSSLSTSFRIILSKGYTNYFIPLKNLILFFNYYFI